MHCFTLLNVKTFKQLIKLKGVLIGGVSIGVNNLVGMHDNYPCHKLSADIGRIVIITIGN